MMKILVVEDERPTAEDLRLLLQKILPHASTSVDVVTTLQDAEQHIREHTIDVLLLDLNLHGKSGLDLLRQSVSQSYHTIIVSANTDKALESYEYGVLDFVPKPYNEERLKKAFARLRDDHALEGRSIKYLSVKKQGKITIIPVDQVDYFKGADVYVEIHLINGRMELYHKTLENLTKILSAKYSRIHKSYIICLDRVRHLHIHAGGKYEVELSSGVKLPVGRQKYKMLKEQLLR